MRTIFQDKEGNDCGVACVAMLARTNYKTACAIIFGEKSPSYTSAQQLLTALNRLNLSMANRKLVQPRQKSFRQETDVIQDLIYIKRDALMVLRRKDHGQSNYHWVVWDTKHKKIRNPLRDDRRKFRITSYYEVLLRK